MMNRRCRKKEAEEAAEKRRRREVFLYVKKNIDVERKSIEHEKRTGQVSELRTSRWAGWLGRRRIDLRFLHFLLFLFPFFKRQHFSSPKKVPPDSRGLFVDSLGNMSTSNRRTDVKGLVAGLQVFSRERLVGA